MLYIRKCPIGRDNVPPQAQRKRKREERGRRIRSLQCYHLKRHVPTLGLRQERPCWACQAEYPTFNAMRGHQPIFHRFVSPHVGHGGRINPTPNPPVDACSRSIDTRFPATTCLQRAGTHGTYQNVAGRRKKTSAQKYTSAYLLVHLLLVVIQAPGDAEAR